MKFKFAAVISAILVTASPYAIAKDIDNIEGLTQAQFKSLSEDIGAILSYKPVSPGEPLGLLGFDIGVEVTGTELKDTNIWNIATNSTDVSDMVPVPKLHLIKGLPLDIDVGLVYSAVPDSNISMVGGELRYAFVSGNTLMPAIAIRASMTKLSGVDELDASTKGLDISISKGFAMLTPYAGIGQVWVDSKPKVAVPLQDESFTQNNYYIGANLNLGVINTAVEYDNTDSHNSYSLKIGWRF